MLQQKFQIQAIQELISKFDDEEGSDESESDDDAEADTMSESNTGGS